MAEQMSISIDFHGLPLIVTGAYYKEVPSRWNAITGIGYPGDAPQFYMNTVMVTDKNGANEIDIESLLTEYHAIEDLEYACVRHVGNL